MDKSGKGLGKGEVKSSRDDKKPKIETPKIKTKSKKYNDILVC